MTGADDLARPARSAAAVRAEKARRAGLLAVRAEDDAARASAHAGAARWVLVRTVLGRWGLPVEAVDGVHFLPPVTPLPGVPAFVAGVVCLAGEALTLVDLGRLGASPAAAAAPGQARAVVVRAGGERVALRVDEVEAICAVASGRPFARADAVGSWFEPDHVVGVAEGAVLLLDIARVLADPRLRVDQGRSERA